jgi:hypothetical protein
MTKHDGTKDPHLPLMVWWAIEGHAHDFTAITKWLAEKDLWKTSIAKETVLTRLMKRYVAQGDAESMNRAGQLLSLANDDDAQGILLDGLNQAFQGRSVPALPEFLKQALNDYRRSLGDSGLVLGIRQGDGQAIKRAIKLLKDSQTSLGQRMELASALGEHGVESSLEVLLGLATNRATNQPALQRVAIASLATFNDPQVASRLIGSFYSSISNENELRRTACRTLSSREPWALRLVNEINQWRLPASDVPTDAVQRMSSGMDRAIGDLDNPSTKRSAGTAINCSEGEIWLALR